MARKIIIDCDMGTDDAVALCMCLFDSRLDVIAVTAAEGCVQAAQANNNLQAILAELDPARYPRLGQAYTADDAPPVDTRFLYGEDGLGNAGFEAPDLQRVHPSEKMIIDCVRANPGDVTILTLGPLTNLARAFRRDPGLPQLIDRLMICGGSVNVDGNITPSSEFNFYFDPVSAREVIKSRTTKTLIPLDVTRKVAFGLDMLEELPAVDSRCGFFLRQVLPFAFRSYRQQLGHETITLNDAVGALALVEADLFEFKMMACDVETEGELTRGATIFDRRHPAEWRPNMEVAVNINADSARQFIVDRLMMAGNQT